MNRHRRILYALLLPVILLVANIPQKSWSQGPCAIFRSWSAGDSFTASDITTSMTTVAQTNMIQTCLDSWSNSTAQMRATTSPYTTTESLAATADGELERLRYMWSHVMGYSQWYRHDENLQLRDRMVANHRGALTSAGEGLYRGQATLAANLRYHAVSYGFENQGAHHETALMLIHVGATARFLVSLGGDVHALSTMATGPGAQRFPAYATHRWHGTGIWFPSDGQLGVSVGGDSPYRFHATGFITHALLLMHAGSGQYTAFVAHANSSVTRTYRLPQTFGTQGQVLAMGPNAGGFADLEWTNAAALATPVAVASGGTGLTSGTSGGILGFTATGTLASSALLTANGVVLGGGAGATPTATGAGSANQVLRIPGAGGAPAFGAIDLAQAAAVTGLLANANLDAVGPGATGPIGSTTVTPVITINAQGRVTGLTSATIASVSAATQAEMEAASSTTVYASPGRVQYHPGVAKVWGQWNDAGNILGSYNISSVTDTGVGDHTVNFTTNFSSTDYAVVIMVGLGDRSAFSSTTAVGSTQISGRLVSTPSTAADLTKWMMAAYGDQ